MNVSERHSSKGHQNELGKVLAVGDYQASFTAATYHTKWINDLKKRLKEIQESFMRLEERSSHLENQVTLIRKHHLDNITRFYYDLRNNMDSGSTAPLFKSHGTCLCCLMGSPEHPLPCGHILCSECVNAYGKQKNATIEMKFCPLHQHETVWETRWKIRVKPVYAGTRILTLDG